MTRLIDADALCEEFKRRQRAALRWKEGAILDDDEERKIRADAILAFLSEVKLTIDNAPTVEERPQGEWIPIKTRPLTEEEKEEYPECSFMYDCQMPEDEQEVLVSTKWGVRTDIYCKDVDGCYFESYCDEDDVLAWMPFPQPYKEVINDEAKNGTIGKEESKRE